MNTVTMRTRTFIATLLGMGLITGCATSGNAKDPIEGFNRAMYAFNDGVDKAVIKPVAKGYDAVLPNPVRTGVTNFFGNIADLFIGVNNLLQGKVSDGGSDLGRVAVNTTVGVLGVFDVLQAWAWKSMKRILARHLAAGAWAVAPMLCFRCLVRAQCVIRGGWCWTWRLTRSPT